MMLPWMEEVAAAEACWIIAVCAEQEACSCGCCHGLSPMHAAALGNSISLLYLLDQLNHLAEPIQESAPVLQI